MAFDGGRSHLTDLWRGLVGTPESDTVTALGQYQSVNMLAHQQALQQQALQQQAMALAQAQQAQQVQQANQLANPIYVQGVAQGYNSTVKSYTGNNLLRTGIYIPAQTGINTYVPNWVHQTVQSPYQVDIKGWFYSVLAQAEDECPPERKSIPYDDPAQKVLDRRSFDLKEIDEQGLISFCVATGADFSHIIEQLEQYGAEFV